MQYPPLAALTCTLSIRTSATHSIEYEGEPSYCLAYDCEYTAFKKLWTNKTCDSNEEPPIVSLTPPVGFAMEVGYSGSSSCASAAASRVNLYALDVCIPRANSPAQLPYKRYSCGSNAFLETHFATADCSDTGTLDKSLATGCAMKEGDYRHVVCGPAGATSTASSVTAASQAVIAVLILLASI